MIYPNSCSKIVVQILVFLYNYIGFRRLFELPDNKLAMVVDMFALGWGVMATWKWRRRLFAWEEELLVRECVNRLTHVVL